jgi:prepilin-type N-terminal cleavage/methylation domain-containing protein
MKDAPRAAAPRTPPGRGFTLIELLVVICILAILTSLVTVAISMALKSSKIQSTQAMLGTIQGALATYQSRWGDYPPSSISELGVHAPNDTNNGIEALVACLSSKRGGGILYQCPEDLLGNADHDRASKNVTDWYFGDTELREYRDFFGNTLIYFHHKDYQRPPSGVTKYVLQDQASPVTITPEKSAATSTFVNPGKFQIWSVGPDGKPGTSDDIRP